jgi:hypothetical protein
VGVRDGKKPIPTVRGTVKVLRIITDPNSGGEERKRTNPTGGIEDFNRSHWWV